jgi:DNA-binding response OmpR family regulator
MDVQMPHCDGYKATQLIRKHSDPTIRNILIIAMTASAIEGDREKCLESGMNNYLAKPVKPNTLKALLNSYLSKEQTEDDPNLQKDANKMVKDALNEAEKKVQAKYGEKGEGEEEVENGVDGMNDRPRSIRVNTTQRYHADQKPKTTNGDSQTGS